ncbi:MAG: putative toxin-antitoxin system toxin component, PIN family [Nanoarchaeota archaeon]
MRITLDTNILISASFWKGDSYEILSLIDQDKIILVTSPEILHEYHEVLQSEEITDKISEKKLALLEIIEKVMSKAEIIEPLIKINVVKDIDDNKIIECAIAGKADYIITNDSDLLQLFSYEKIPIITPKEFLSHQ